YDAQDRFHGSRAALEVRAHDVPFMVEHGQRVCKLTFERMLEEPTALYGQEIGSSYQRQEETLGKHFAVSSRTRSGRSQTQGDTEGSRQLPLPIVPR
ncbi:MAG TPA: 2'-deoxycytidine 5'-triphosphate deaminase, partial [Acidimicrobiales bacterium]|nr:2'-deoxycytidine 5'-triphosphate deaminase [Acidimicrobiales bacterium]